MHKRDFASRGQVDAVIGYDLLKVTTPGAYGAERGVC